MARADAPPIYKSRVKKDEDDEKDVQEARKGDVKTEKELIGPKGSDDDKYEDIGAAPDLVKRGLKKPDKEDTGDEKEHEKAYKEWKDWKGDGDAVRPGAPTIYKLDKDGLSRPWRKKREVPTS